LENFKTTHFGKRHGIGSLKSDILHLHSYIYVRHLDVTNYTEYKEISSQLSNGYDYLLLLMFFMNFY